MSTPPSLDKIEVVKKPEEDKERSWHIDKDKQLLRIELKGNETVFAEASSMPYMSQNVNGESKRQRLARYLLIYFLNRI